MKVAREAYGDEANQVKALVWSTKEGGSIPSISTKIVSMAEVVLLHLSEEQDISVRFWVVTQYAYEVHEVEHSVGIWEVVGSNPIVSSKSPHGVMGAYRFYIAMAVVRFHLGIQSMGI